MQRPVSIFCANSACHGNVYTFAGFDAPKLREILKDQLPTPEPTPEPPTVPDEPTFENYVGPVFATNCTGCHGDLATGALALGASLALARKNRISHTLFWVFSAVGLYDLMNVAYLLLAYYPLYSDAVPSSAPAFQFSLVLIPTLAAPMALLLHLFAVRSYLRSEATTPLESVRAIP